VVTVHFVVERGLGWLDPIEFDVEPMMREGDVVDYTNLNERFQPVHHYTFIRRGVVLSTGGVGRERWASGRVVWHVRPMEGAE
jgi:hypothetical protein